MRAIHFGAGNIGRGFIGKILADAGWQVTFADVNTELVDQLARRRQYHVQVVGEDARSETVSNVDAISSLDDAVIERIAHADLVTTAVGMSILPRIAPVLARGIERRFDAGVREPLNVIACENAVRGTSQLKQAVLAAQPDHLTTRADNEIGFADSAVDRIVPPAGPNAEDPLSVTVEAFSEWIVDRTQLRDWQHDIAGMQLTDNLMAFIERKLFTLNTGHAITAYLGFQRGLDTIGEAIATAEIREAVRAAMAESGEVLVRRYGFDTESHQAYIDRILQRFANPWINDDVRRVGREPLRKLGSEERLARPLRGTLEYGLPHHHLECGIAAALHYKNDDDPQAVEMQTTIAELGVEAALARFCDNTLPAELIDGIAAQWRAGQTVS